MTRDDGAHSLGDAIRRQVLESIPEDPAVDYLELLRNTGITKTDLDRALADLENLGVINKKDGQSDPSIGGQGPDEIKSGIRWTTPPNTFQYQSAPCSN